MGLADACVLPLTHGLRTRVRGYTLRKFLRSNLLTGDTRRISETARSDLRTRRRDSPPWLPRTPAALPAAAPAAPDVAAPVRPLSASALPRSVAPPPSAPPLRAGAAPP